MIQRYQFGPFDSKDGTLSLMDPSLSPTERLIKASDYDALALAVYDECSRQGCFCPTDPATGECSFCKLSLALNGFEPQRPGDGK